MVMWINTRKGKLCFFFISKLLWLKTIASRNDIKNSLSYYLYLYINLNSHKLVSVITKGGIQCTLKALSCELTINKCYKYAYPAMLDLIEIKEYISRKNRFQKSSTKMISMNSPVSCFMLMHAASMRQSCSCVICFHCPGDISL